MKASSILFATILFLVTGRECKGENKLMETKCVLEIKLASQSVKPGQDFNVTVQLKNTGSHKLWVNKRMLLNRGNSPAMMRELWVDFVGPDGEPVPFSSHVRAGEAVASNFAVLNPGQAVSKQINLSNSFDLAKPGAYQITVHYQDGTQDIPKAPAGALHLQDQLSSAPAKFQLVAP
jgi:hypothetical protein